MTKPNDDELFKCYRCLTVYNMTQKLEDKYDIPLDTLKNRDLCPFCDYMMRLKEKSGNINNVISVRKR